MVIGTDAAEDSIPLTPFRFKAISIRGEGWEWSSSIKPLEESPPKRLRLINAQRHTIDSESDYVTDSRLSALEKRREGRPVEVQPTSSDASEVEDSSDVMTGDGRPNDLFGAAFCRQRHNESRYQSRVYPKDAASLLSA